MNGHISDKPDCLLDGCGYLGTHNYPSFITSCIDIAKPINSRKILVSEFNRDEDKTRMNRRQLRQTEEGYIIIYIENCKAREL